MYICFKGLAVEKPYIKFTNKSVGVDLLKSWITRNDKVKEWGESTIHTCVGNPQGVDGFKPAAGWTVVVLRHHGNSSAVDHFAERAQVRMQEVGGDVGVKICEE